MILLKGIEIIRNNFGKPIQRKIQKTVEEVAYSINYDVGESVKKLHEVNNKVDDYLENIMETTDNALSAGNISKAKDKIFNKCSNYNIADHLYVYRIGYTHHGLYIGNGKMIHYSDWKVLETDIYDFADGADDVFKMDTISSPIKYPPDEVVHRARSRSGENKYNLIYNNCENFVRWCRCGDELL